jgi:peptide/nickel transport system permease protein
MLPALFAEAASAGRRRTLLRFVRRHAPACLGATILLVMTALALLAPLLTGADPLTIDPLNRLKPPSPAHWFGTDMYGRDVWTRTIYGGRVSLAVGFAVATVSVVAGTVIGLLSGYIRWLDPVVMRFMDGLMAIPAIMLAIALMALTRPSIGNVIVAISVAEVPRVVRLVRGVVLTLREEAFVQGAIAAGTRLPMLLLRHILPNVFAPLIVQGSYVFAAAILIEAALSFLGVGAPPTIPSWGNIVAEGRSYFVLGWWIVLIPGLFLATTVLAVNLVGDGLRDALDPRAAHGL